jgi:hypothetical protein
MAFDHDAVDGTQLMGEDDEDVPDGDYVEPDVFHGRAVAPVSDPRHAPG